MSKSGSRYGRRSNWFKIHCLLQEQQQAQTDANQIDHHKLSALSPNQLSLMRHSSYASNFLFRPPCSNEEQMMLKLEDCVKHPHKTSSPSTSESPGSHNSGSSVEMGNKTSSMRNHNLESNHLHLQQQALIPLAFGGFPFLPTSGFSLLPSQSHFLLSNYHNALYDQKHQLTQQVQKNIHLPLGSSEKSFFSEFNEDNMVDNDNASKHDEMYTKDIPLVKNPKRQKPKVCKEEILKESEEALTPPRSPKTPNISQVENIPIDLSLKSNDLNHYYCENTESNPNEHFIKRIGHQKLESIKKKATCYHTMNGKQLEMSHSNESDEDYNFSYTADKFTNYGGEIKRRKIYVTAPLDLTTKIVLTR